MNTSVFNEFLASDDTLRVYEDGELVFSSTLDGLLPLLEYLDRFTPSRRQLVIFDRAMGNAAALLAVKAGASEVFSPLGSRLGLKTLDEYGIKHHLTEMVDCILQDNGIDMCPMEKLSLGKNPEEFFQAISNIIKVR